MLWIFPCYSTRTLLNILPPVISPRHFCSIIFFHGVNGPDSLCVHHGRPLAPSNRAATSRNYWNHSNEIVLMSHMSNKNFVENIDTLHCEWSYPHIITNLPVKWTRKRINHRRVFTTETQTEREREREWWGAGRGREAGHRATSPLQPGLTTRPHRPEMPATW